MTTTPDNPIRVQQICPLKKDAANGIGTYCNALADLFKNHDSVTVLPPFDCPVIPSRLFNDLLKWKPFYQGLKASDADILHINGYTSFTVLEAFIAARLLHKKVVYTAHWHPFQMLSRPLFGKVFFNVLVRPFLRKTQAVVTLNKEDTSYFSFMGDRVRRIPHWNRLTVDDSLLRISKKANMILFVGRFNADNKGFDYLYSLPEGKYDIHCVGAGTVVPRSDMTVHSNIPVEELKALYAQSSLVVIPSKYEAFSYVALEALSFNTPVVMSDRVRIGDYVSGHQGVCVFPYGNKQAFVESVEKTIASPVDRESILNIFRPEVIRDTYARLYQEIVEIK